MFITTTIITLQKDNPFEWEVQGVRLFEEFEVVHRVSTYASNVDIFEMIDIGFAK